MNAVQATQWLSCRCVSLAETTPHNASRFCFGVEFRFEYYRFYVSSTPLEGLLVFSHSKQYGNQNWTTYSILRQNISLEILPNPKYLVDQEATATRTNLHLLHQQPSCFLRPSHKPIFPTTSKVWDGTLPIRFYRVHLTN